MLIRIILVFLLNIISDDNIRKKTIIRQCPFININTSYAKSNILENNYVDDLLLTITIKKINLTNRAVYNINSSKNNIEKNITILKESNIDNNFIILAAHSGIGPLAYFKDLDKLNINDSITINYDNKIYEYIVESKELIDKDKYIYINKKTDYLILTTCSKNNKQLVINAKRKKTY